jgi:hypothetical protein
MNTVKLARATHFLFILAALTFWMSWFLMPDPGTTDAKHILEIVKQSRSSVLSSSLIQIVSCSLYVVVLFLTTQFVHLKNKTALTGIILFGIGLLGMCSDAFFHVLAYFMTDTSVAIEQNVVQVMHFMQTGGVYILVPILLPFFIGSLVLAIGLRKQGTISKIPTMIFIAAFTSIPVGAVIIKAAGSTPGNSLSLFVLGLFAIGHIVFGSELKKSVSPTT